MGKSNVDLADTEAASILTYNDKNHPDKPHSCLIKKVKHTGGIVT